MNQRIYLFAKVVHSIEKKLIEIRSAVNEVVDRYGVIIKKAGTSALVILFKIVSLNYD